MGNEPYHRSRSPDPEPSRTHYTVHCHKHTWINVYDGYDQYWYDHYRNSSGNCSQCANEENERERKLAQQRAQAAKEAEENRVKALKEKLEQEERDRQEQARLDRKREREAEEKRLMKERQDKEKERLKIQQDLLRESEQKIEQEINRLKSIKTKNPYIAWKKCDTIKVVKDIGNQALECSITGQIVLERVDNIKCELKESLKHDYKTVKPEIERYEKYGKEMKSMTKAFIKEFSDVFRETTDTKEEFNVFADDLKEAQENKDKEDEQFSKEEMKNNINSLSTAISKMKLRLLLMEQYYVKMQEDYQFFIEYLETRSNEFKNQKDSIISYLDGVAKGIKKKRDIFQGTELKQDEVPKETVEEKYDMIKTAVLEKDVVIGTKTYQKGKRTSDGEVFVGAVAGAAVGGVVGFIPGMIVGGIVGACVGACIHNIINKKGKKYTKKIMGKEKRMVNTKVKNGGRVVLEVVRGSYDGLEHAKVLRDIGTSMKKPIDDLINEMKTKKQTVQQQMNQFKYLESDVKKMLKNVNEFKLNVNGMKKMLNEPNGVSDRQRKQLDKKWKETSAKIDGMLKLMEKTNNNQSK